MSWNQAGVAAAAAAAAVTAKTAALEQTLFRAGLSKESPAIFHLYLSLVLQAAWKLDAEIEVN
jgi:hypothetical protein